MFPERSASRGGPRGGLLPGSHVLELGNPASISSPASSFARMGGGATADTQSVLSPSSSASASEAPTIALLSCCNLPCPPALGDSPLRRLRGTPHFWHTAALLAVSLAALTVGVHTLLATSIGRSLIDPWRPERMFWWLPHHHIVRRRKSIAEPPPPVPALPGDEGQQGQGAGRGLREKGRQASEQGERQRQRQGQEGEKVAREVQVFLQCPSFWQDIMGLKKKLASHKKT